MHIIVLYTELCVVALQYKNEAEGELILFFSIYVKLRCLENKKTNGSRVALKNFLYILQLVNMYSTVHILLYARRSHQLDIQR